jgi:hypothetical protein
MTTRTSVSLAVALAAAFAAALASCIPSRGPQGAGGPSARLASIDGARAAWMSNHGPRQAVAYARAVHEALGAGAYQADPHRWRTDLPDSIQALDQATAVAGADAAQLVAWRAVLLADNAQPDDALNEYERSLALGPTYLAAAALAAYHGRAGRPDRVHAVCGETVARLTVDAERFDLMAACQQASNALTEETGLPWATPEQLAWYRAERQRRQQIAAAEADAARARQQDDLRARRDQMLVGKLCREECTDTASRCYADCGDIARDACSYGCESSEEQCLRRC